MAINFIGDQVKRPMLKYRSIKFWLKSVIGIHGFKVGNVCYIFCSDEYLKSINLQYLNHDYFTDIVTFDYSVGNLIQGDMFISIDRVRENALFYHCEISEEFLRVIVHGLLHLIGFNDGEEDEKKLMRFKENEYLDLFKNLK